MVAEHPRRTAKTYPEMLSVSGQTPSPPTYSHSMLFVKVVTGQEKGMDPKFKNEV